MRSHLASRQEEMRKRIAAEQAERERLASLPVVPEPEPKIRKTPSRPPVAIDHSQPVEYHDKLIRLMGQERLIAGVYLLTENGEYYIGQSKDVLSRKRQHLSMAPDRKQCSFENPTGAVLGYVKRGSRFPHNLLRAERRFQAAALRMGLNLVNKNLESGYVAERMREDYSAADLKIETEKLRFAVDLLDGKTVTFRESEPKKYDLTPSPRQRVRDALSS